MAAKRKFEIYYVESHGVWVARYLKYQAFRATGTTPPIALRNLIQKLDDASKKGMALSL